MAKFCTQCGGQANDDATVCPVCGAAFGAPAPAAPAEQPAPVPPVETPNQGAQEGVPAQPAPGAYSNPNAAAKPDTLMCILSYFGILALVPYLSKKDDDYIQFHAKQGMNLFIIDIIASVAVSIVRSITGLSILGLISTVVSIFVFVLSIMGIVAACKGERKVLPLMDKIKIIK